MVSAALSSASVSHVAGPFVGHVVDRIAGEPPNSVHPLIAVGNGLATLEKQLYRDSRCSGVAHVGLATAVAVAGGLGFRRSLGPLMGDAAMAALCSGGSMLWDAASTIGAALEEDDLAGARELLPTLVGRDPSQLDQSEIARAVIESVAENTVDAVTATLWWGVVGGAPLMAVHRVTNTLDAMIGHRTERYNKFGWAAAKLDDALNWIPARLTAAAIAVVASAPTMAVLSAVRRDGGDHPSPNGGRVEAAMAGALGVTLGGANNYGGVVEVRGALGDGPPPDSSHVGPAVAVSSRASWLVAGCCLALGLAKEQFVAAVRSPVTVVSDH